MAVTSIWPIKGRLSQVIGYVMNPEKTTEEFLPDLVALHAIQGVVEYAADQVKTEQRSFVSGIGCTEKNAVEQFMRTKQFWNKMEDGRVCYHGYQSFPEGEVTAEQAHSIGVALAMLENMICAPMKSTPRKSWYLGRPPLRWTGEPFR